LALGSGSLDPGRWHAGTLDRSTELCVPWYGPWRLAPAFNRHPLLAPLLQPLSLLLSQPDHHPGQGPTRLSGQARRSHPTHATPIHGLAGYPCLSPRALSSPLSLWGAPIPRRWRRPDWSLRLDTTIHRSPTPRNLIVGSWIEYRAVQADCHRAHVAPPLRKLSRWPALQLPAISAAFLHEW